MNSSWRIVRVKSNCEKKVAAHLTARSIESYLPSVQQRVQWTGVSDCDIEPPSVFLAMSLHAPLPRKSCQYWPRQA